MKKLTAILFLLCIMLNAQSKDAGKLIEQAFKKFESVNDYQADLEIKLAMEFIKAPPSNAKIFFKKPNKYKIESNGFSIVPKQVMDYSPAELMKGDYTKVFVRTDKIGSKTFDIVKLVPNTDTSDFIIATLWINNSNFFIEKTEVTTKRSGTVKTDFTYTSKVLPIPSEMKISFNIGDEKETEEKQNPQSVENKKEELPRRGAARIKGGVIISYKNYKINKGIPDSVFEEKKK